MPLDSYPFSERYGWTEDRFGLSWQVMHAGKGTSNSRSFRRCVRGRVCGRAEEAIDFYVSVFPQSERGDVLRYESGEGPDAEGTIKHAAFTLAGLEFAAMDSALEHDFGFNEAISFMVSCDTQDEIDFFWERLSAVPEAEQCGWLKDRFGVSWQVVPSILGELLGGGTAEQTAGHRGVSPDEEVRHRGAEAGVRRSGGAGGRGPMTVHTYLNFGGNAQEAFDFYRSVFGGEFASVVRFGDFPMEGVTIAAEDEDKIMHIGLPIGEGDLLMASDALESLGQRVVQGNNVYVSVHPTSQDEADRVFEALSEGAEIEMPIADAPWGDYFGSLKDRFGVQWMVNYSPPREGECVAR